MVGVHVEDVSDERQAEDCQEYEDNDGQIEFVIHGEASVEGVRRDLRAWLWATLVRVELR